MIKFYLIQMWLLFFAHKYENEISVIAWRSVFWTFMTHVYSLYYLDMQPQTEIEIGESGAESNAKAAASTIPKIYLGLYEDILFLLVTSLENARKPLWYVYCEKIPINYCVTLSDMTKWPMCKLVNVFTVRLNLFTAYKRKHFLWVKIIA